MKFARCIKINYIFTEKKNKKSNIHWGNAYKQVVPIVFASWLNRKDAGFYHALPYFLQSAWDLNGRILFTSYLKIS